MALLSLDPQQRRRYEVGRMLASSAIRRASALTVVAALALSSAAPAGTFFFCNPMQETMRAPCCPQEELAEERPSRIEGPDCCEAFSLALSDVPSETQARRLQPLASPPLVMAVVAPVEVAALFSLPFIESSENNTGPPIIRITQAILI